MKPHGHPVNAILPGWAGTRNLSSCHRRERSLVRFSPVPPMRSNWLSTFTSNFCSMSKKISTACKELEKYRDFATLAVLRIGGGWVVVRKLAAIAKFSVMVSMFTTFTRFPELLFQWETINFALQSQFMHNFIPLCSASLRQLYCTCVLLSVFQVQHPYLQFY